MRPFRAFCFSFTAGLFAMFASYGLLSQMLVPTPDVRVGPLNIPSA